MKIRYYKEYFNSNPKEFYIHKVYVNGSWKKLYYSLHNKYDSYTRDIYIYSGPFNLQANTKHWTIVEISKEEAFVEMI